MEETQKLTERVEQLKFLLTEAMATLEAAGAEADDTQWPEEKEEILYKALTSVLYRFSGAWYDHRYDRDLLTTKEAVRFYVS
jgi:Asp-tRNA(Asn)/Glu-tRNA(Gln) amidotransferase A subunit family amidase